MATGLLRRRRPARGRDGFTLLEVMVAMVLLSFMLLGVHAAITDRLVRETGTADKRNVALQLVAERIQTLHLEPVYGQIETRYAGVENPVTGFPNYRRTTTVRRTNTNGVDYKTITVTVERTGIPAISRTITIGAP